MTKEMAEAYLADDDLGAKGRLSMFAAAALTGIIAAKWDVSLGVVAEDAWNAAEKLEEVRRKRLAEATKP